MAAIFDLSPTLTSDSIQTSHTVLLYPKNGGFRWKFGDTFMSWDTIYIRSQSAILKF